MGRLSSVVESADLSGRSTSWAPECTERYMAEEGKTMVIPFAFELYIRHIAGETAEELSSKLGIPRARVQQRLLAGAAFAARHASAAAAEADAGRNRAA